MRLGGLTLALGYFPFMPFKQKAACRHRIPRARCRVTNGPAYEAGWRGAWISTSNISG